MGLSLLVGYSEEDLGDAGTAKGVREEFRNINRVLRAAGRPTYRERLPFPESLCWSCSLGSYGNLHYLRRFAAGLAVSGRIPEPMRGVERASESAELTTYWKRRESGRLGPEYDHLMNHSDCDGYYVPADFPEVLNADGAVPIAGPMLGSSVRLKAECEELAGHLGLHLSLDFEPDDDDGWKRLRKETRGAVWHKYRTEASVCAVLHTACERSIHHRAAIVFG